MKITKMTMKNFKAFYGEHDIELGDDGKNLLIYGENGSGKTSIFTALRLFVQSAESDVLFLNYKNIFVEESPDEDFEGFVRLHFREKADGGEQTFEWSPTIHPPVSSPVTKIAKTNGFIDYKSLLATHYLYQVHDTINIFDLLIQTVLANVINDFTQNTFHADWLQIQSNVPIRKGASKQLAVMRSQINEFNNGLKTKLDQLQDKANEILNKFEHNTALGFLFDGVDYNEKEKKLEGTTILLNIELAGQSIDAHHKFLNEARLSSIALSFYLASVLIEPKGDLKILALDDVVIGLDMSNRLKILNIIEEYFVADYQVFITTYDNYWFEIINQRVNSSKQWKSIKLFNRKLSDKDFDVPIIQNSVDFVDKAKKHIEACDYKAAAVYLRSAFEKMLKNYCKSKQLQVPYKENSNEYTSEDFWTAIKNTKLLDNSITQRIETCRKTIMNPLSHYDIEKPEFRSELEETIKAIKVLNVALENLKKSETQTLREEIQRKDGEIRRLQKQAE